MRRETRRALEGASEGCLRDVAVPWLRDHGQVVSTAILEGVADVEAGMRVAAALAAALKAAPGDGRITPRALRAFADRYGDVFSALMAMEQASGITFEGQVYRRVGGPG